MILSSDHSDPLTSHRPRMMSTSHQGLGFGQTYTRPQLTVQFDESFQGRSSFYKAANNGGQRGFF